MTQIRNFAEYEKLLMVVLVGQDVVVAAGNCYQ